MFLPGQPLPHNLNIDFATNIGTIQGLAIIDKYNQHGHEGTATPTLAY